MHTISANKLLFLVRLIKIVRNEMAMLWDPGVWVRRRKKLNFQQIYPHNSRKRDNNKIVYTSYNIEPHPDCVWDKTHSRKINIISFSKHFLVNKTQTKHPPPYRDMVCSYTEYCSHTVCSTTRLPCYPCNSNHTPKTLITVCSHSLHISHIHTHHLLSPIILKHNFSCGLFIN